MLSKGAAQELVDGFRRLRALPGWANARDVLDCYERMKIKRSNRVFHEREDVAMYTSADASSAIKEFIVDRSKAAVALSVSLELASGNPIGEATADMDQNDQPGIFILDEAVAVDGEDGGGDGDDDDGEDGQVTEEEMQRLIEESKALFDNLDADVMKNKGNLGEKSFEGVLESMGIATTETRMNAFVDAGLDGDDMRNATGQVVDALVEAGVNFDEAKRRVQEEVTKWLEAKREAARRAAALRERLRRQMRTPRYICGYCKRRWGVCTYLGPVLDGYDEASEASLDAAVRREMQ